MSKSLPTVSVIISTYNRPELLIRAVKSVIEQTYDNIEIIVVDDCSDYNVANHISDLTNEKTVKLLQNNRNKGANWSRKKGIKNSNGELIAFLDDDDLWHENKLEKQVTTLQRCTSDVGVVTVGRKVFNNTHKDEIVPPETFDSKALIRDLLCRQNPIGGFSCVLVRRSVIDQAGYPDCNLNKFQDIEWYIRLAKIAEFRTVPEPLVFYDADPDRMRMTDIDVDKKDEAYKYVIKKYSGLIEEERALFRKKISGCYYYRKSENRFKVKKYSEARKYALKSIYTYPFKNKPYAILIATIFGDRGLKLAQKLNSAIK